jgi:hypothetical protein
MDEDNTILTSPTISFRDLRILCAFPSSAIELCSGVIQPRQVSSRTFNDVAERLRTAGANEEPILLKDTIQTVTLSSRDILRFVNLLC